jgi:predicted ATP-dependent Lon-type protease
MRFDIREASFHATKAQSKVRELGSYTFIDKLKVRYLSEDDKYWAELVNFGHRNVHIPEQYVRQYDRFRRIGIRSHRYSYGVRGMTSTSSNCCVMTG